MSYVDRYPRLVDQVEFEGPTRLQVRESDTGQIVLALQPAAYAAIPFSFANPGVLRSAAAMLLKAADRLESDADATIETVVHRCDESDAASIREAIEVRSRTPVPDFDGDEDACQLAEVCRAYLDLYGDPVDDAAA